MRGNFRIHYQTAPGQRLQIVLGEARFNLQWLGGGWWGGSIEVGDDLAYHYSVVANGAMTSDEPAAPRLLNMPATDDEVYFVDRWRPFDQNRLSRGSALFSRSRRALYPDMGGGGEGPLEFNLHEPWIPPGWVPAVVGSSPRLGGWDPTRAIRLVPAPFPTWKATAETTGEDLEYKYVLIDADGQVNSWEEGPNRVLPATGPGHVVVQDDELRGLAPWRGAGVAVPVFSLRTERDVGVGQFSDLVPFADWAADVGISVIQLLPVNDTVLKGDWDDSYPYNPVSVQALHPLYMDLDAIEGAGIGKKIASARRKLAGPEIDYPGVVARKFELLRTAYSNLSAALDDDAEFAAFVDEHWDWLGSYSLWCVERDRSGTGDFTKWGALARFDPEHLNAVAATDSAVYDAMRFYWFVQFHLHRQLNEAADYVRSRGIALKGDLPIGVAPESVEVWTHPELFHIGTQTGAPPDAFTRLGQNWGFPTYNWDRMAEDDYAWWKARFHAFAAYVDAYRIDHVLGFFRIWEIPPGGYDGLVGHFRPSLPLKASEVVAAIGSFEIDAFEIDALTRPVVDAAALAARFGDLAGEVTARFFVGGADGEMALAPAVASQEAIRAAFRAGALAEVDEATRSDVERGLLDVAADLLLVEIDGGYAPTIAWQDSTHYRKLSHDQQQAFDALATDFFHHRHAVQWEEQGRKTLPAIVGATDLLACGEDLGMVPDLVPRLMNEMGLLSLEIERMPKRLGEWIADPATAPYLSVFSPGTHDTTTMRQWWEEDPHTTARYWHEALGQIGDPPPEMTPRVAAAVVGRQLASPAMLCIIPIADLLATDPELRREDAFSERINDPANRHNRWRYRIGQTIAGLAAAEDFNSRLRALIADSGRA